MGGVCTRGVRPKFDPRLAAIDSPHRSSSERAFVNSPADADEDHIRDEALPIRTQLAQLVPAIAWALCGWNILVGFPEALYWHLLDPSREGIQVLPLAVLGASVLSPLLLDCCGLQRAAGAHAGALSVLPPLLYVLSAAPWASARSACLTAAAAALGWSAVAVLDAPVEISRHPRDMWACLISLCGLLMLRWSFATMNPLLAYPWAQVGLGSAGILAAASAAWEEGSARFANEAPSPESQADEQPALQSSPDGGCCKGNCQGNWLPALATGLMGGSALLLFQTYLSTLEQPAGSALMTPSYLLALLTLAAVALGIGVLAAVYAVAPWWLDSWQAALFIGALPLLACTLQACVAEVSITLWGPVWGTGSKAHGGLLVLAAVFPLMLALFAKELSLLARSRAAGRALFVIGVIWVLGFLAHLAVIFGGDVPFFGHIFKGRLWLLAVLLGVAWGLGVIGAPNGAGRPSVQELWYLSQHSAPARALDYTSGGCLLLFALCAAFCAGAVPVRVMAAYVEPPASSTLLTVAGYNVQQGYDLHGRSNVRCVAQLLGSTGVDLAGLSASRATHMVSANNDVLLAYGSLLKMHRFEGAPGALASVDQGILSRLPFDKVSSSSLEVLEGCKQCPTQTHLWARSRVTWNGQPIEFHTVHAEWRLDPSPQIKYVAEQIRMYYSKGPLILVGDFSFPKRNTTHPWETALLQLVQGTGLREAFGALGKNVNLPLPPTQYVSGLHLDYIFYRGLELESALIHSEVQCSHHMPVIASFRAKTSPKVGQSAHI